MKTKVGLVTNIQKKSSTILKRLFVYGLILTVLLTGFVFLGGEKIAQLSYANQDRGLPESVLRIGFDPTLPPYQFVDEGVYKGFLLDLSKAIFSKLKVKTEFVPMPMTECLEAFNSGKLDVILGLRYNAEYAELMNYSDSLVNSTISIVMPTDTLEATKDILGVKPVLIAVERDSVEFEYVKNIKKANFNNAFNQEAVVELLLMNRADMMICVRHVAEYILEENGLMGAYTFSNSYETPVDYYMALRKNNERLLEQVNETLRQLKLDGEYEILYNQWINDKNLEHQKRIEFFLKLLGSIVVLAVFVIILSAFLSISLKRRVDEKTSELSEINKQLENKIVEIKNTNELKNLIFESSPRSIVILDNLGCVSAMNVHACEICGLETVPIGASVETLFPLNKMAEDRFQSVLKDGESHSEQAFEVNQDGQVRFYRFVIYPLMNSSGAIITIEDITEEKILKEQVAQREKNTALMRIISGIAHEIRNPMTSIKTYAELLPRKKDNAEFQRQIAKVVPNEVERVNRLIENLIDYSRPKERNEERADAKMLVESGVLLFMPTLRSNQIELDVSLESGLYIRVDKDQMKQVIINLILNAIDAILERREQLGDDIVYRVKISAKKLDSKIVISLEDNGIGMTDDELKNIFELFYTTKVRGSGIGMPLSRQMVEDNHGDIEISSEKYVGTQVSLLFEDKSN